MFRFLLLFLLATLAGCASFDEEIAELRTGDVDDRVEAVLEIEAGVRAAPDAEVRRARLEFLKPLLSDRSGLVRGSAAEAMARLRRREALPELLPLLRDRNPHVRLRVATGLRWVGGPEALRALKELLRRGSESNRWVRREAAKSIGIIGDESAIPVLIAGLEDPDEGVRFQSARALTAITGQHFGMDADRWRLWNYEASKSDDESEEGKR